MACGHRAMAEGKGASPRISSRAIRGHSDIPRSQWGIQFADLQQHPGDWQIDSPQMVFPSRSPMALRRSCEPSHRRIVREWYPRTPFQEAPPWVRRPAGKGQRQEWPGAEPLPSVADGRGSRHRRSDVMRAGKCLLTEGSHGTLNDRAVGGQPSHAGGDVDTRGGVYVARTGTGSGRGSDQRLRGSLLWGGLNTIPSSSVEDDEDELSSVMRAGRKSRGCPVGITMGLSPSDSRMTVNWTFLEPPVAWRAATAERIPASRRPTDLGRQDLLSDAGGAPPVVSSPSSASCTPPSDASESPLSVQYWRRGNRSRRRREIARPPLTR